jgi:hypothetical protein
MASQNNAGSDPDGQERLSDQRGDDTRDQHRRPEAEDGVRPISGALQHRRACGRFGDAADKHAERKRQRDILKRREFSPDYQTSGDRIEDIAEDDGEAGAGPRAGFLEYPVGLVSAEMIETRGCYLGPDGGLRSSSTQIGDRTLMA